MRRFHRSSLALIGLSVLAPSAAHAQGGAPAAPAGYAAPMMMGIDGKPVPAASPAPAVAQASAAAPAARPHVHKKRHLCASCQAKEAQAQGMPVGTQIVACAHSKNGVCPACQTLLAMPGQIVMGAPAPAPSPGDAPGRAVASSGMSARAGSNVQVAYDPGATPEPAPIGVVQANFAQGPGMGMGMPGMGMPGMGMPAAGMTAPASQPGRAVVSSGAGSSPYQPKMQGTPRPHILGHLFGWSAIGADHAEERAKKKSEAHASIPYNNEGTAVNELPASMVFGPR